MKRQITADAIRNTRHAARNASRLACLASLLLILAATSTLPVARADGPAGMSPAAVHTSVTLRNLGQKSLTVNAVYDRFRVRFPLAEGRQVQRALFKLHLSHGKKLLPQSSDLTIALNDEPVASLILSPKNAAKSWVTVELPVDALQAGTNTLLFRVNQRLHKKGCGDVGATGLWTKIWSDSALELDGADVPVRLDLARFPRPFDTLSTVGDSPQIMMVLPAQPNPAELTVAAQVAAALGRAARWKKPPLEALTYDRLNEAKAKENHLIAIGSGPRNPLAAGEAAGLHEVASPYNGNRVLLVVSAPDETQLRNAGEMLSTRSARATLNGAHAGIAPVTAQPLPKRESRATFADLGFADRQVRGIGLHDLYYPLDVPYSWKITSDASMQVRFTHAHSLDATRSVMQAFVNGFQVANVPLTNRNDTGGRLVIQLSPRQLHPGRNWLHLAFALHVKREDCNFRYLQEAWARISATGSTLNLAHVRSAPPLELRYLPSPLVTPPDLRATLFVLPARPTAAELTAMVRLAAKLGTYSGADGLRPRATTDAQFAPQTAQAEHVVAIGGPEHNSLVARYEAALPQQLAGKDMRQDRTKNVQQEILEPLPESIEYQSGYIQVLPAPWSGKSTLMVISAYDEALLARAVAVLPVLGQRLKVQGNVAVVMPKQVIGLSMGGLAGAPLPAVTRKVVSAILFGGLVLAVGLGLIVRRRKGA
ncbi:MAG: cellulose biosynthesis cyclic di-GMP-binding regulatory protein BcsB [Chloroflexi bacterium]|nr:cellulose biosynthesis cyclic di-GMP-binding regulatory protein BcsB [Chloroflexota bacterium]